MSKLQKCRGVLAVATGGQRNILIPRAPKNHAALQYLTSKNT